MLHGYQANFYPKWKLKYRLHWGRMVTEVVKARLGAEDQALRNNDMLQACVDAGMSEAELAEMCFLFM